MKKEYYVFKINLVTLNVIAIIIAIIAGAIACFIDYDLALRCVAIFEDTKMCLLLLPYMLGYMILHELLHAIGYIIHGADSRKITFGMDLEKGVLYCLCKQDVTRRNILNASMYPLFYIGIVTFVISIIFKWPLLLLLSIINISGAAGDIMYFIFISKLDKNIMFSELDDGIAFAVLSDKDVTKVNHFGLDFVEKLPEIPRSDFERVKISKLSWSFVIISLVAIIGAIFIWKLFKIAINAIFFCL